MAGRQWGVDPAPLTAMAQQLDAVGAHLAATAAALLGGHDGGRADGFAALEQARDCAQGWHSVFDAYAGQLAAAGDTVLACLRSYQQVDQAVARSMQPR